jgi:predicted RNase H-like HicB family nuclease
MYSRNSISKSEDHIAVKINVFILKEDDLFVAYSPALELSSYGDTEDEAKEAFQNALQIFIEDTQEKGTLEKVLLSLGWTLRKKPRVSYQPPTLTSRTMQVLSSRMTSKLTEQVQLPI